MLSALSSTIQKQCPTYSRFTELSESPTEIGTLDRNSPCAFPSQGLLVICALIQGNQEKEPP